MPTIVLRIVAVVVKFGRKFKPERRSMFVGWDGAGHASTRPLN